MEVQARFSCIWMVFVIYIVICVEGVNFGEDCSVNPCSEADTTCDTGNSNLCICSTGFFRETAASKCSAQVALNANCAVVVTDLDQCSVANSECRDDGTGTNKCLCETTHFETGGACNPIVALNGNCDVTDTAPDQCSVANSACRDDGTGTDKCLCETTHYENAGACELRIALNTTCTVSANCIANAECRDDGAGNQCYCKDTHNPDGNTCVPRLRSGVIKVTMVQYMYVVPIIVSMMILLR